MPIDPKGLQIIPHEQLQDWLEQASDPSAPETGYWILYFKSGGVYVIDDAGVVTGPLGTGGAGSVDAADVTYTPDDLNDWFCVLDPGDVQEALDQLAARVTDEEGRVYDAGEITFTPSDLDDWLCSLDPGDAKDALDELASRVTTLEDEGGGGGLTYSASTVTTGNVTGVEGTLHALTIAGLTAERKFTLPTPSAAGKYCGMIILDGDADYSMMPQINSVDVDGYNLFIAGELLIWISTGTGATDWEVYEDGRIKCKAKMHLASAQTITTGTNTIIEHDTPDWNIGDILDISNYRFVPRRAGKYEMKCGITFNLADQDRITTWIMLDGSAISRFDSYHSSGSTSNIAVESSLTYELSAGALITHQCRHEYGSDRDTLESVYNWPRLSIKEVF